MATDKKALRMLICPVCFAKDIDPVILHWDEAHQEYYCQKCTFTGGRQEVAEFFRVLQKMRYGVNYDARLQ